MPKKVSELFTQLFSTSKHRIQNSSKLATDAAPLPDESPTINNDQNALASPDLINSSNLSNEIPCFPSQELVPTSAGAIDLRNSNEIYSQNNYALSNTQAQNIYQFSQINGLHIGSVYNVASAAGTKSDDSDRIMGNRRPNQDEPIKKTKTIDAMMKSSDPLTYKSMIIVSTHLGSGWRNIVRFLGFSDGQIDQMYENHHTKGIQEVIYQFLLDYSRNDDTATLGNLTRILWKNDQRECVFILKESWKNGECN